MTNRWKHHRKIQCDEVTKVKKTAAENFHSTAQTFIMETLNSISPYVIESPRHKDIIKAITYHQERYYSQHCGKTKEFQKMMHWTNIQYPPTAIFQMLRYLVCIHTVKRQLKQKVRNAS